MKKLLIPLMIITLIVILFFSWCQYKLTSKILITDIDSMAIQDQGKVKKIVKNDDVEKVVLFINSIDKKVTIPNGAKGWQFYIRTKGKKEHTICFKGDMIEIDRVWYRINTDEGKKMREIFVVLKFIAYQTDKISLCALILNIV